MTVVIALRCLNGLIMASDSQATESTGNVRFPDDKVFQLHNRAVWGGSGRGQLIRDMRVSLDAARAALEASGALGQDLVNVVKPHFISHYSNFIQAPGTQVSSPATSLLACGLSPNGQGWIIEIDEHCSYTHYDERGFHAIGSAAGFAHLASALMAHFDVRTKPLSYGKLIAYRAMDTAISTSAYHVGPPIQMWIVTEQGAQRLTTDDLSALQAGVGGWKELEIETLNKYLGQEGPEPEVPLPEELQPDGRAEPASDAAAPRTENG